MAETYVNFEDVHTAANDLRELVTDATISRFEELRSFPLSADGGVAGFDAATWVEEVADDRREGLIHHVTYLKQVFTSLADRLDSVATEFETTDREGADALDRRSGAEIDTWATENDAFILPPAEGNSSNDSADNLQRGMLSPGVVLQRGMLSPGVIIQEAP